MNSKKEPLTPSTPLKGKVHLWLGLELQKMAKSTAWDTFWKTVHFNNQALWAAAEKGDLATIKSLVMNGKNKHPIELNSKGPDEWTALHFAAYENHVEIENFLIQNGANINSNTRFLRTALHISTIRGHMETVRILCDNKINIDSQDEDGNTALHFAVENDYPDIVEFLLKKTQNILKTNTGKYPMDVCRSEKIKQLFDKLGITAKKIDDKIAKA